MVPGLTLLGYATGLRILAQLVPAVSAMVPETAVSLALAGIGLWLVAPPHAPSHRRRAGQALSLLVALYGVVVLVEYLTGHNLSAEPFLFADRARAWSAGNVPGRPSPQTAVALVVTGLALALLDADARGGHRPARVLAPAGGLVAAAAVVDHAYALAYLSGPATVTSMAYNTAATFVALSAGILACRPERTAAQVLLGAGPGGAAVRRLAPIAVVAVLLVGVLLTAAGNHTLPDERALVALVATELVLVLYLAVLWAGKALNDADRAARAERYFSNTVLGSLPEGVITVAANGTVLDVTPRWCEITGYPPQEVIGRTPPYPWWPPERATDFADNREASLAARGPVEFDMIIRRRDGADVETLVTASPMRDRGGPQLIVGTYRDLTERNRIEAERRRATDRLDHYFSVSTDLLCIAGSDGYFKHVNPAWERIFGYTADELMSRPYVEFIHPDDMERTRTEAAELLGAGKVIVAFENRFRCRDGSYRWLNWNATPAPDDGLIYAVGRDTTDQRQADELRGQLAAIVKGTQDAVVGKTLDGTITSWNPAAERHYGYTAAEAVGRSIRILLPPEDPNEITRTLDHVARGEPVELHNAVRVRKDGSRIHVAVSISPVQDSAGRVVGAASIARDITERIRADERFQRLVLAAPDAMLIAAQDGTIILVNEQTERLFGYPAADLIGQPVEALIPPHLREQHVHHRRHYLLAPAERRMGTGAGLNLTALHRDGKQFPVEVSLAPLDTDDGTLVSAAIRDVTERRQVEQDLADARDEALAAAHLKSQFVAMVSHEIRTPMNGVIGLTNLLLEAPLEPGPRRYVQAIRTSGQALLAIINDILDFSKIEAGKIELVDIDYDLDQLIEDVIQAVAEPAHDKGLELLAYYPPELPTALRGDAGRLRQALLNLLGNAVKFTEHGEIQLRVEPSSAPNGRPQIAFAVTDTGIGIAEKDLHRLFEPFSQVDGSTNREFGGTGLGLTITRQLVDLMHGQLNVESQPGQGSRFSFTIPVTPRRNPAGRILSSDYAGPAPTRTDPGNRGLILLAEDNTINQMVAVDTLETLGYQVDVARNGIEALELATAKPYLAILMDCQMPKMDGYAATTELRHREPPDQHIPVIAMTAGALLQDRERCLAAGMDDYLAKPIDPDQLQAALDHWTEATAY